MTAEKGKLMKKTAAVVAGVIMALGAAAPAFADAEAEGIAIGSPGFLSGNVVQFPIDAPFNACGNTSNVNSLLSPSIGNLCVNH
ncbi:chaplin [Streptomyces sp. NPDC059690]|uniref:chaplin n=1 Tax=Streptomyces sp. NPDC059690 TaxID=3346907 RepID=UPI0036C4608B